MIWSKFVVFEKITNTRCVRRNICLCNSIYTTRWRASNWFIHMFPKFIHFFPVLLLLFAKNNFRRNILRLKTLGQIEGASISPLPVPSSDSVQWLHYEYRDDYRSGRNNFRRYIEPPHQSITPAQDLIITMWLCTGTGSCQACPWCILARLTYCHVLANLSLCFVKRCALTAYRGGGDDSPSILTLGTG